MSRALTPRGLVGGRASIRLIRVDGALDRVWLTGSATSPPVPRSSSNRSGSSRKGSIPTVGGTPGEVASPLARPKPGLIDFVASKLPAISGEVDLRPRVRVRLTDEEGVVVLALAGAKPAARRAAGRAIGPSSPSRWRSTGCSRCGRTRDGRGRNPRDRRRSAGPGRRRNEKLGHAENEASARASRSCSRRPRSTSTARSATDRSPATHPSSGRATSGDSRRRRPRARPRWRSRAARPAGTTLLRRARSHAGCARGAADRTAR